MAGSAVDGALRAGEQRRRQLRGVTLAADTSGRTARDAYSRSTPSVPETR